MHEGEGARGKEPQAGTGPLWHAVTRIYCTCVLRFECDRSSDTHKGDKLCGTVRVSQGCLVRVCVCQKHERGDELGGARFGQCD